MGGWALRGRHVAGAFLFAAAAAVAATMLDGSAGTIRVGAVAAPASNAAKGPQVPVSFQPNVGQVSAKGVKFLAQTSGASVYLTSNGAVIAAPAGDGDTSVVGMKLVGTTASPAPRGTKQLPGTTNYLIGRDRSKWHTDIHSYAGVRYRNVYPGIDLVWHGTNGKLEYDYVVAPGADPNRIRLGVVGARSVAVGPTGELAIRVGTSTLNQQAPVLYQTVDGKRRPVTGRFELGPNATVGFRVGSYDHSLPLTIDPLLYSTYLGGSITDFGLSVAVDSAGNTYVGGQVSSTNFPTLNPFQSICNGCTTTVSDAFVSKLNPSGTALVYSTYLGGSAGSGSFNQQEAGRGIAVDSSGDAFVVGGTNSNDFPTTAGAYIASVAAVPNAYAFVTKLNPAGNGLVYSTYLGAPTNSTGTAATAVAVDSAGEAYVTGDTLNTNYPTVNPFQASRGVSGTNATDAFVTKFNASGSALVFSSYLGGGLTDQGNGIALDSSGDAYVTGLTSSSDFPTANAFQASESGTSQDAFVTKVGPSGALLSSTYFGGSGSESGNAIAVDGSGNAYITGSTSSTNLPTQNPFQAANGGGTTDAFVAELSPSLSSLTYSSYIGGTGTDAGNAIAVDAAGNAYSGGNAGNATFPTLQSLQAFGGGSSDAYVTKVSPTGSRVYSTLLGGNATDTVNALALDASGNPVVTGIETSTNFPTVNAIQSTNPGGTNAFVSDVSIVTPAIATQASSSVMAGGSISDSATLTGGSSPTGLITFNVYGPGDPTCATSLGTSTATVSGDGTYTSTPFVAPTAGTYQWTASYGGDSNNSAAAETAPCGDIAEAVIVTAPPATSAVASASTAMTATTNFSTSKATASCPAGSTLTSGGDTLTRSGAPVTNDGAVSLGLFPADGTANNSADGATTPGSWNAYGGYSGQAPGLDTVTSYAVCASNLTAATVVKVTATAAGSLGPVTAVCPTGSSLVGGGGGFSGFISGTNAKLSDSYPSDSNGTLPANGASGVNAWTVKGQSNTAAGEVTTAVALCATDVAVAATVASATVNNDHASGSGGVPGGSNVASTISCAPGTVLLAGGSHVTSSQNGNVGGPGNGGQGVHLIGDYPSDSGGTAVSSGPPGSWTVVAQNGGQNLDALDVTAYALCAAATTTPTADLSLTNSGSPDPVAAGSTLTYTLTASNAGPSPATDATVTDTLPSGTTFVSAASTSGTCTQSSGVVTCNLGTLASGGSATMTVKVVPTSTGSIHADASITAVETDPHTANNSATATNTVGSPVADLSITNDDSPDPVAAGSTLTYTIVVTNGGPDPSTGGVVTDTLPATATFVSATGTTGSCGQTSGVVTCFTGTLANGATSTITLKVTPTVAGPLSDTASVSGNESDPNGGNNSALASTTITKASPTLTTQASAATTVGQPLTDVATLAAGSGPTGTITFNLYGPSDTSCAGPTVFSTTKTVTGNGSYTSAPFTSNALGTYRWVVTYGGDASNNSTAPGTCGDSTESTAVGKASPTLSSQVGAEVATLGADL
jgi:uncharacterized repeat protein (TIGR01451 family)